MILDIQDKNIYVTADIHNDADRFQKLLQQIDFSEDDILIIAGDIFDRGDKPVELYFEILKHENIYVIQGNHDVWFRREILAKLAGERVGEYLVYNTFELMSQRLTRVDMLNLAQWIGVQPYYIELHLGEKVFQISHAQTYPTPNRIIDKSQLYMGSDLYYKEFLEGKNEVEQYISVVGHCPTDTHRIWISPTGRTIRVDCGNGYAEGRLGAIRLNDMQEYYV